MDFVWLVLPALPLSLPLLLLGLPGAPSPRALSPCPARPSPSGRLAVWGALAPCAGCPPGAFRRLRAAGARSGTAPQAARSPRTAALASLATVVQKEIRCTNPESGAMIDLPSAGHFRYTENKAYGQGYTQGVRHLLAKKTKESRPKGRLSPYLDTIGDYLRKRSCRKFAFVAQSKGNLLPLSSYCAFFRTKPLAIAGEIWYNDIGKVSSP